ncbi:MAG TPA: hypothetical protein VNK23_01490 [Candidatus Dormibacteraeota bacterium]|nr:hypothetical protein [Candidatus Dormibacteraeota bacterium]
MRTIETVLLVVVNAGMCLYFWRAYERGMPVSRVAIYAVLTFVGVNVAAVVGRRLGDRGARRKGSGTAR